MGSLVAAVISGLAIILAALSGFIARQEARKENLAIRPLIAAFKRRWPFETGNQAVLEGRAMTLNMNKAPDPARRRLRELQEEALELLSQYEKTAKWSKR